MDVYVFTPLFHSAFGFWSLRERSETLTEVKLQSVMNLWTPVKGLKVGTGDDKLMKLCPINELLPSLRGFHLQRAFSACN